MWSRVAKAAGRIGRSADDVADIARPLSKTSSQVREATPIVKNSLRSADDAEKLALNAEKSAADAKSISNAEKAGTAAGNAAERAAKAEGWGLKKGTYVTLGVAGVGTTIVLAVAGARYDQTNGKTANITNIERVSANRIKITFDKPSEMFSPARNDEVQFNGVPCTPDINSGRKAVIGVGDTDNSIIVDASIDKAGQAPWGSFTCYTSFGNQVSGSMSSAIRWAGDIAGDVVGAGTNVVCGAVPALCDIIPGLAMIPQIIMWICIALSILVSLGGTLFIALKFMPEK